MKKRILSVILALLMIAPALTACSDKPAETGENPAADPTASGAIEEVTPDVDELSALEQRQLIPDNLPDVKYNGRDYLVETETRKLYEILSEDLTGEATNDAVYNRNLLLENRFDVHIGVIEHETPYNEIVTAVT
ncbi:MAG: hypothetical protein IK132_06945, partial [Clostridia bacterium]|nr:hypothetical protein [Clostridia bacterium]